VRTLVLLVGLLLFVAGGIYGIFSKDFVQIYLPVFNWFLLLAVPVGIYYGFALIKTHDKNRRGGVALGRIAITIFVTMIVFRSIQGYLILYNCNIGMQTRIQVRGRITQVRFPMPKKIFDKYSIDVYLPEQLKTITLEVPSTNYQVDQSFDKEMVSGSLNIIYGSK
jgi:hypothetical protein